MLSQTKFYKKHKEEILGGLAVGLVVGLVVGLAGGLAGGLIVGLAGGLVVGLGFAVRLGLVWGLVAGLIVILFHLPEVYPYFVVFPNWLFLIIGILIISEIMFLLMKEEKLKKNVNIFWHTCKRKLENIFEVLLGFSFITQVYILIREGAKYFNKEILEFILKGIGYIGLGILGLVFIGFLFYVWIKLNSLKYEK